MLEFKNSEVRAKLNDFNLAYTKGLQSLLMYDKFMRNTLSDEFNRAQKLGLVKFPMEINIAPSIPEMLKGNFEPAKRFIIEEPIYFEDTPIWWGSSLKGVNIRLGFQNGDRRKPCRAQLNDKDIHGLLAGITGMGKSVTLNIIIFGVAFEYAPWEAKLITLDAKAADIKKFGEQPLPHISAVAATHDTDYILSVLHRKYDEMNNLQAVFGVKGVNNIEDFRKVTGLIVPREVIVFDEFTAAISDAGKDAGKVSDFIDSFARLGRSTGKHLILASQEFDGSLPSNTLNNITVRMCLGANEKVSEKVLGNTEANTIQTKGKIILNTSPGNHSTADNLRFQVPFQPSDGPTSQFSIQGAFLKSLGKDYGYHSIPDFYDEKASVYEKDFPDFLNRFKDTSKIYLGEPSFVMDSLEKVLALQFTGTDIENIIVAVNSTENLIRYGKILNYNIARQNVSSVAFAIDSFVTEQIKPNAYIKTVLSYTDDSITQFFYILQFKLLLLAVDNKVQENQVEDEEINALLEEHFEPGSPFLSSLNRSRAKYLYQLSTTEYSSVFELYPNKTKKTHNDLLFVYNRLLDYEKYNSLDTYITPNKFPLNYYWFIGLQNLRGIGRQSTSKCLNAFVNLMFDSYRANVRFIILTTNLDDCAQVASACRYAITDKPTTRLLSSLKITDFYPNKVPNNLGVLSDKVIQESFKFKKMKFDNEI